MLVFIFNQHIYSHFMFYDWVFFSYNCTHLYFSPHYIYIQIYSVCSHCSHSYEFASVFLFLVRFSKITEQGTCYWKKSLNNSYSSINLHEA